MPSLATFVALLVASLPLWQITVAMVEPGLAINHRFNKKKELFKQHLPQHKKRATSASSSVAASSSYSSSSYAWPASSTFDVPPVNSASYSGSVFVGPTPTPASCGSEDCKFYSHKTAPYFIPKWPGVEFETGEFYGGSTPVSYVVCESLGKPQANANFHRLSRIRSMSLNPTERCSGYSNQRRASPSKK
jgi:hypothetical protein